MDGFAPMWALGLMSGTSMDGIDAALVKTDGVNIFDTGPATTIPYTKSLKRSVRAALGCDTPSRVLIQSVTDAHLDAITTLLSQNPGFKEKIKVVGLHGHTVMHAPDVGITLQVGDGKRLSEDIGIDVVCDFRSTDVAFGGQGAPLTPLYHCALGSKLEKPLVIVNIGGIANLTWIDSNESLNPIAFDAGPGNCLLDDWVKIHTNESFDRCGEVSSAGSANDAIVTMLMDHPYFLKPPPKSLDRLDLNSDPILALKLEDGAATLVRYTCRAILASLKHLPDQPKRLLITGGGRHNQTIMRDLSQLCSIPVEPVETVGWDGDALEAQAFAFLAVRSLRGLHLTLPTTTGVPFPATGGVVFQAKSN